MKNILFITICTVSFFTVNNSLPPTPESDNAIYQFNRN